MEQTVASDDPSAPSSVVHPMAEIAEKAGHSASSSPRQRQRGPGLSHEREDALPNKILSVEPPFFFENTANLRKGGDPERTNAQFKPKSKIDDMLGETLGSYRILSLIGEGGMGRVYLAEHKKLGREVALKLLRTEYAVRREGVQRFFNEAQAVNRIGHPNIVDITDFVELETGQTFIIMELLQGSDLSEIQRQSKWPMPIHRAMHIALQVCEALEAAHKSGIIHRDLKPDNIFIVNSATKKDFVKLLDFGVAKLLYDSGDADGWQTAAGAVIGTPAYMSPEQASGIPADSRSDIYSLGAILYELFTGYPVFQAKSFGEYVVKHMNDDPIPPRDLADAPKIPSSLERVILRCLEKDPNRRYASMSELSNDLGRAVATVETALHYSPQRVGRRRARSRILLVLIILLGVGGLAVGAFLLASGLSINEVTQPRQETQVPSHHSERRREKAVSVQHLPPTKTKGVSAKLTLHTEPEGAEVFRKGNYPEDEETRLGKTPLVFQMATTNEEVELVFRLAGYEEAVEKVIVADNLMVSVALERKDGALKSPPRFVSSSEKKKTIVPKLPLSGSGISRPVKTDKSPLKTAPPQQKGQSPTGISPEDVVDPFSQ